MDQGFLSTPAGAAGCLVVAVRGSAAAQDPAVGRMNLDDIALAEGSFDGLDADRQQAGQAAAVEQGLGRALLATLLDLAPEMGFETVWGSILASNTPMRALAERLGFEISRDPDDYQVIKALISVRRPIRAEKE